METIEEIRDFADEVAEELENNLEDEDGVTEEEYDIAMERLWEFEAVLKLLRRGGDPLQVAHKLIV